MMVRAGTNRMAAVALSALCLAAVATPVHGQGTLDDYRRASTVTARYRDLVVGVIQSDVTWIGNSNRFWYRVSAEGGHEFVLVDADAWQKQPAFDHARLASALSSATGQQYTARTIPFSGFAIVNGGQAVEVDATGSRWRCALSDYACTRVGAASAGAAGGRFGGGGGFGVRSGNTGGPVTEIVSPDSTLAACIRNYNVAIRPIPHGVQAAATQRGPGGFGGGRPVCAEDRNAMLLSVDASEGDAYQLMSIEWSPDSKKLIAYRRRPGHDRVVHFVRSSPLDQVQPKHETSNRYLKPGDVLDFHQPVLFDVATKKQTIVDNALFPRAYQISRPVWRKDSRAYTFEYNQRGHQAYRVLEVNAETGAIRTVIDEQTRSFFAYRPAVAGLSDTGKNFRFDINDGKEILWMSERDGWNHLYLYDGVTGRVKNQVTRGEWLVKAVDSVDVEKRQIYFSALGMNADQDPYFIHHYRIDFDGKNLVAFTEANGTHAISWSPNRQYYVDVYSRVDLPTVVELRRVSDRRMLALEKGDMSRALAAGFTPPEVFKAKGRDGKTDIWGIIVKPHTFDANKKYPVIEQIYAGPQGSFVPKSWGGGQNLLATAELGFVLVQIDGMGTNNRSKAFHDVAWKNLKDAGFPDRILWHKAVNAKYPWFDISRVGVYGGSAGGQNAAGAVFLHGDFYDAAFASSGCHDNRMDKIWWNEHWMGEMGAHYEENSNVTHAHRLKGRLFLAVGEMDTNVDPASTMQVADALIRAGKDFELLVVPNGGHGATGPDGNRRRSDFFLRSLYGITPPDWNAGASLAMTGNSNDAQPEDTQPLGFFEDPNADLPPFVWW